jgi:hypothetical protein
MNRFDRSAVAATVARLDLTPAQGKLAEYWLSLWNGDVLPPRNGFHPARVKTLLPMLAIFDVVPDRSVTVRLAGTAYTTVLGRELTGTDWLGVLPAGQRASRLRSFSEIARGAIGKGTRRIELHGTKSAECFEFLLPFQEEKEGGNHPVICHVEWKAQQRFVKIRSWEQAVGVAQCFETIALPRATA